MALTKVRVRVSGHRAILPVPVAVYIRPMTTMQLVAEWIRRQPCNRKIVGSIPVYGRFATPFSKEFNLTMLKIVHAST